MAREDVLSSRGIRVESNIPHQAANVICRGDHLLVGEA